MALFLNICVFSTDHVNAGYGTRIYATAISALSWKYPVNSIRIISSFYEDVCVFNSEGQTMVLLRLAMNLGGSYGIKDSSVAGFPDPGFRGHALRLLLPGGPKVI